LGRRWEPPAATEGAIELDDGRELIELGLGQGALGQKQELLFVQDFVVARLAAAIVTPLDDFVEAIDGNKGNWWASRNC
jgi:hypothetical protein